MVHSASPPLQLTLCSGRRQRLRTASYQLESPERHTGAPQWPPIYSILRHGEDNVMRSTSFRQPGHLFSRLMRRGPRLCAPVSQRVCLFVETDIITNIITCGQYKHQPGPERISTEVPGS